MNIFAWIVIGWLALGALLTVAQVGKARPVITGGVAAASVVLTSGVIALVVLAATT